MIYINNSLRDEMVDIPVLGTGASRRAGSSPAEGNKVKSNIKVKKYS